MFLFISVALLWTRNSRRWRKGNGGGGWWLGVLGGVMGRSALLIRQPLSRDCRSLVHSSSLSLSLSLSLWGSISLLRSLSRDAMENFPKLHSTDNANNAHLCIWIWDSEVPRISCSVRAFWEHVFYGQSPPHPQAPKNKPLPVPVFFFF